MFLLSKPRQTHKKIIKCIKTIQSIADKRKNMSFVNNPLSTQRNVFFISCSPLSPPVSLISESPASNTMSTLFL